MSSLTSALRALHPAETSRRPGLFVLEITAALLSVLSVRDAILHGSAPSLETLLAAGLWAILVALACGLTIREAPATIDVTPRRRSR